MAAAVNMGDGIFKEEPDTVAWVYSMNPTSVFLLS
jgi:hypothetical protein